MLYPAQTKEKIIIWFKSTPENFEKEKSGVKPNTIRNHLDWNLDRIELYEKATHVGIRHTQDKDSFIRKITDKTSYDVNKIISWNPNEESLTKAREDLIKEIRGLPRHRLLNGSTGEVEFYFKLFEDDLKKLSSPSHGSLAHQKQNDERIPEKEGKRAEGESPSGTASLSNAHAKRTSLR